MTGSTTERPIPTETVTIAGPAGPIEILVDRWGVPHIYAASRADAFFGQGFAVARDRLWQIDLWRKRGLGLLAADHGPAHAAADAAARLFLYRGDMAAEWAAYGPGAEAAATAFVGGINAYIAFLAVRPERLPPEFALTGTTPAPWRPEDCVRIRTHGPLFNLGRELVRSDVVRRFGLAADAVRKRLEPAWTLRPAEGIAAEPIPENVDEVLRLATGQPQFAVDAAATAEAGGSNNWAIRADRTSTQRPILASDPHRAMTVPSLRYVSHLVAPDLDVIGAGEPSSPGIAVGHNATSAFCFTIHPADQADLFVYEIDPDRPDYYRYAGGWEAMTIVEEEIAVRGAASQPIRLAFTRHGPVLYRDVARRRAYAACTVWSLPGSAPYLGSLRYLDVASWDGFVAARSHWNTPPLNHVYADTAGTIGWIMSGAVPIRPTWDGLMPVAGDGRHEWTGFMPDDVHPRRVNPACGWVASANQMNLPDAFDVATYKPGFEWADPARFRVIARALDRDGRHSLADSRALQTSYASPTAERLLAVVRRLAPADLAARAAADLLAPWNGVLLAESGPAMLYELWFRKHLIEAVCEALVPGAYAHFGIVETGVLDTLQTVELLEAPDARFGADPVAVRDALVERTLAAAWHEAVRLAGADPSRWRWDRLHHARFVHPLSGRLGDDRFDTRRVGKGGSALTPNAGDYRLDDFAMTVGASFRMVLDVGAWDEAVFVNAPGQSGDPRSRHYDDHLDAWGREDYLPLLYGRERIEDAAELRLWLHPAAK